MNEEIIRKYAELMKELELTGLEITQDGGSIRLERNVMAPALAASAPPAAVSNEVMQTEGLDSDGLDRIISPMIGVFYQAPAENAAPFVKIGDRVKKGDTLCIIEAMKLMNEVTAERDGVIRKICVSNGDTVEYGTVLFLIGD